jgi:formate dehydrogenase accessory protein FdhD
MGSTEPRRGLSTAHTQRVGSDRRREVLDRVIEEAPVALVYNGVPFAVMMATPCDLEDFALGFALSEGIVASPGEFELVEALKTDRGISLQGLIPGERFVALQRRKRSLSGRSGCGLCGIESLEEAVRPTPRVANGPDLDRATIAAGMRRLAQAQPLNAATGGAHAAAFISREHSPVVREDVGRHNALDKLIGALARTPGSPPVAAGFLAITSRASWEIVHKTAHAGMAVIAAISAPTSLAIEAADAAGITLIAFARDDSMNIYTHAARIA